MSEQERCTIEEIKLDHSGRQYVVLPEIIFQTDDVILVGTGSLSCVRALYRTAARKRAQGRFYYEVITPEQYAAGQAEKIIGDLLEKAIRQANAGGVIYYASCMDVVSKIDFDKIRASIRNPEKIKVEVLYRGPMVRRYLDSNKKLTELLLGIPYKGKTVREDGCDLPPVMPDFEAICGALHAWKTYRFLVSAGGCDGCVSGTGSHDELYRVTKSRVDDLDIALGIDEKIKNGVLWDYERKKMTAPLCLTGAGIPKLVGMDYERLLHEVIRSGLNGILFRSDGFHCGEQGMAEMYLELLEQYPTADYYKGKSVAILGGNCYATPGREHVEEGIKDLKKYGLGIIWPEENPIEQFGELKTAECSWVLSVSGLPLAKKLENEYDIPYILGLPIGKKNLMVGKDFVLGNRQNLRVGKENTGSKTASDSRNPASRRILLTGDPVIMGTIGNYLTELGYSNITYAVYTQLRSQKRWYNKVLKGVEHHFPGEGFEPGKIQYVKNRQEFADLVRNADIVFADIIFQSALTEGELAGKKWVDIPMPIFNCGIRTDHAQFKLYGIKGARWINSVLR